MQKNKEKKQKRKLIGQLVVGQRIENKDSIRFLLFH